MVIIKKFRMLNRKRNDQGSDGDEIGPPSS